MWEIWITPFDTEAAAQQWREGNIWKPISSTTRNGDRKLPGGTAATVFGVKNPQNTSELLHWAVGVGSFKTQDEAQQWLAKNLLSRFSSGKLPDGKDAQVLPERRSGVVFADATEETGS